MLSVRFTITRSEPAPTARRCVLRFGEPMPISSSSSSCVKENNKKDEVSFSDFSGFNRYCNRLAAPVLRDMPTWPLGGVTAPRSETQSLRELPTAWLRKLSARCEQDATNTLDIATKAMLQKKPAFTFLPESKRLVSNAVTLAHCVQHVASLHELYLPSEINVALDMALTRMRPVYPENNDAFRQVQSLVSQIVGFLQDEKPVQM